MKAKQLRLLVGISGCVLSFVAGRWGHYSEADRNEKIETLGISLEPQGKSNRNQIPGGEKELKNSSSGEGTGETKASLLGPPTDAEMAKTPIERVKDAFAEPKEFKRLQLFWRALSKLRPEDAQGIQDLFDEGDRLGRHYPAEYQYFAQRWGEVDGAAAVAHGVEAWQHRGGMDGMLSRMADGWASQNPQQAVEWLNTHPKEQQWMQDAVMEGLVNGLADKDLELARRFVEDRWDDPKADHYFSQLADKYIYNKSLAEAETWFDSLDGAKLGNSKARLLDHLTDRFLRGGPDQAAAFLDRHPDQITLDSVMRIGSELSQTDPAKAKSRFETLPENIRNKVEATRTAQ